MKRNELILQEDLLLNLSIDIPVARYKALELGRKTMAVAALPLGILPEQAGKRYAPSANGIPSWRRRVEQSEIQVFSGPFGPPPSMDRHQCVL